MNNQHIDVSLSETVPTAAFLANITIFFCGKRKFINYRTGIQVWDIHLSLKCAA